MSLKLGSLEAELLKWVADREEGASVREAFDSFNLSHGMARTTVLTMLDRLHEKGALSKTKTDGEVFRYRALESSREILRRQVVNFVRDRLKGSWAPLVATFADEENLTDQEKEVLQGILQRLDGTGGEA
ncbi:MAG: BlaI/MecI/CopY family transcriptional regulator [Bdellovibrionaceae bacterium]|nr:BlaI/MecI/CopY family transcriptional regulator [Pseudobdellovibrionaceae bacterium]